MSAEERALREESGLQKGKRGRGGWQKRRREDGARGDFFALWCAARCDRWRCNEPGISWAAEGQEQGRGRAMGEGKSQDLIPNSKHRRSCRRQNQHLRTPIKDTWPRAQLMMKRCPPQTHTLTHTHTHTQTILQQKDINKVSQRSSIKGGVGVGWWGEH